MPRQATASSQEQDVTELTKYKKRRQILLELPSSQLVPPRKFRRWDLERIKAPEKEVVGMLRGEVGGERTIYSFTRHISRRGISDSTRGRPPLHSYLSSASPLQDVLASCADLLRIHTTSSLSIACLHDISSNGFFLNGKHYPPWETVKIGDNELLRRSVILRDGDTVRLPGHDTIWTYYHNDEEHGAKLGDGEIEMNDKRNLRPAPLFVNKKPYSITICPWVVHNFALGSGSFGVVNLATHQDGGVQVACKTVSTGKNEALKNKLDVEIDILKSIRHPNLLGILDVIDGSGTPGGERVHLILEVVTGGDLFSYVEKHRGVYEDELKFMARQLLDGLAYLHGKEIVHRDIKPENILLHISCAYPRLLIADFGHATTLSHILMTVPIDRHSPSTRIFKGIGTPEYTAPERLKLMLKPPRNLQGLGESIHGGVEARRMEIAKRWFEDEAALDAWGLGCILFLSAVGQHPYNTQMDPDADGEAEAEPGSLDDEGCGSSSMNQSSTCRGTIEGKKGYAAQYGSVSWDHFREEKGEGALGFIVGGLEGDVLSQVDNALKDIGRFSAIPVQKWEPGDAWKNYGSNAKTFISSLLAEKPSRRLRLRDAKSHNWLKEDEEALEGMYESIVVRGKMFSVFPKERKE